MGVMLPDKNAFDFTVRVQNRDDSIKEKKKEDESGKARLSKILLQLKKKNTKPCSSKGMATVKINY